MMTETQKRELRDLLKEHGELTLKKSFSPADIARAKFLGQAINLVRSGVSLQEILQMDLNDFEARQGLPKTDLIAKPRRTSLTPEQELEARSFQDFVFGSNPTRFAGLKEQRDQKIGVPVAASSLGGSLGAFVPNAFFPQVFAAMKWYDVLFDPDVVRYVETTDGRPMQFGFYSDVENVATLVTENVQASEVDLAQTSAVILNAYTFKSPIWKISLEALQDLEASYGALQMFKDVSADRIARGVSKLLLHGNGTTDKILGLITTLAALSNGVGATATGSAANTGGSENGQVSIGSADMAALMGSIDPAYLQSPKCGWLMNNATLTYLRSIVTKQGQLLVDFENGMDWILGYPVYVSPSMDSMTASPLFTRYPVAFGDLSYWVTKCSKDPSTRIQVYSQAQNYIEQGTIGFRAFVRYDGALLYSDTTAGNSNPPIRLLQMHA
jgi:HK97 family phage major capsid protein